MTLLTFYDAHLRERKVSPEQIGAGPGLVALGGTTIVGTFGWPSPQPTLAGVQRVLVVLPGWMLGASPSRR